MAQTKITITHDKDAQGDVAFHLITSKLTSKMHVEAIGNFLNSINGGVRNASITTSVDDSAGASASGTVTFSGVSTANDTLVISGVTFTAVASGAAGNQWNVGASASAQATNVAAAINAASSLVGILSASASGAVVTLTSLSAGAIGNAITFAKGTDAGSVMTVGGLTNGRLGGGSTATVVSSVTYKFGV